MGFTSIPKVPMTIHRHGPLTRPGRATEAGLASTEDLPNEQFGATLPVYYPALVRLPPTHQRNATEVNASPPRTTTPNATTPVPNPSNTAAANWQVSSHGQRLRSKPSHAVLSNSRRNSSCTQGCKRARQTATSKAGRGVARRYASVNDVISLIVSHYHEEGRLMAAQTRSLHQIRGKGQHLKIP